MCISFQMAWSKIIDFFSETIYVNTENIVNLSLLYYIMYIVNEVQRHEKHLSPQIQGGLFSRELLQLKREWITLSTLPRISIISKFLCKFWNYNAF